jgi:hypothetical protein
MTQDGLAEAKGPTLQDKAIIRDLAEKLSAIAHLPVQNTTRKLWRDLNSLNMSRPMVMVYAFPWEEAEAVSTELKLQTVDPFCRQIEQHLRRLLYKWRHMRADMVVDPVFLCPIIIEETVSNPADGKDITRMVIGSYNVHTRVVENVREAKAYQPVLRCAEDLEKIRPPVVRIDHARTDQVYARCCDLLEPALHVQPCGVQQLSIAPMDALLELWGINELMIDMVERPELIHLAMDKLMEQHLSRLSQYVDLKLLSYNHDCAGSITQGMGECFTDELPGVSSDPANILPKQLWGGATAQIFSGVSPDMHEEFALRHERRWLDQFGLTAYGCCEPLHQKIGVLKQIKNLRKISMSSWIEPEMAAASIGRQYVFSYKPRPTFLAMEDFSLEATAREMDKVLHQARTYGCPLEFIQRTIISYRQDPQRLAAWVDMAMSLVGAEGSVV